MADPVPYVYLDAQVRGDEFSYTSGTIANSWTTSMFTGGVRMTIRTEWPKSSVLDDTDAGVVDFATDGGGDLVFPTTSTIKVVIPGDRTTAWPAPGKLFFDVQGIVTVGSRVLTLCRGEIPMQPDATRTQA